MKMSNLPVQPLLPGETDSPQLVKRGEELSRLLGSRRELYRDTEAWAAHQELAKIYRRLLLTDLEYALDKKVEQQLWNVCFKNYISHLQATAKDKRAKNRGDAQVTLAWFLENASGFYILLLEELRNTFHLDIPFLQSGSPYGMASPPQVEEKKALPGKASCNYVCQHCLVHLGDIARYRSQTRQAESFYRHAITMAPSSGQPYNQIAILEASRANKLSTVYFYVRAVCLSCPFPAASINLSKLLGKLGGIDELGEDREHKERTGRVTGNTFIPLFLRVQGQLHHSSKLRQVVRSCQQLSESLTSLIASDSFSTWQLLQISAINMWVWEHCEGAKEEEEEEGECTKRAGDGAELSPEERLGMAVAADLQAALLSAALLPVYTLKKGKQLLDYAALPAARIILEWILSHPNTLKEKGFLSRPQIWPSFSRLLNEIEPELEGFDSVGLQDYPLPEDFDLQSFRPLSGSLSQYNCRLVTREEPISDTHTIGQLRFSRLVDLGKRLSVQLRLVERGENEWSHIEQKQQHTAGNMEDLVALVEGEQDDNNSADDSGEDNEEDERVMLQWENVSGDSSAKGILKSKKDEAGISGPRYRARQNVAMAAILRANQFSPETEEDRERKVMFRTPSPTSTQGSGSQEQPDTFTSAAKPKRSWSPPLMAPKPRMSSVTQLDFSRPPPSLHSNFRPPKLAETELPEAGNLGGGVTSHASLTGGIQRLSSDPLWGGANISTGSYYSVGEPSEFTVGQHQSKQLGHQQLGHQQLGHQHQGHQQLGKQQQLGHHQLGHQQLGQLGKPPQLGKPEPLLDHQSLATVARPQQLFHSDPGGSLTGGFVKGSTLYSTEGATYPDIAGLNMNWPSPDEHHRQQQQVLQPQQQQQPAAYSLFSSSSWPGPLLAAASSQSSLGSPVRQYDAQPSPVGASPSTQAGQLTSSTGQSGHPASTNMFGPGPSPLERLLHQNKSKH